jgi:hypothetical protein
MCVALYQIKALNMKSKYILSFLRVSVSVLFFILLFFSVFFLGASIVAIMGNNRGMEMTNKSYTYKVKAFGLKNEAEPITYSQDSIIQYHRVADEYAVQVDPKSSMGYYSLLMKLVYMGLGLAVLWNFKKIFKETNLRSPFKNSIIRRLKTLAILFIVSDLIKLADYFLFNSYLHQSIASPKFQLLTDVGNGFITGLVILIIAVIYERGKELEEENALTV